MGLLYPKFNHIELSVDEPKFTYLSTASLRRFSILAMDSQIEIEINIMDVGGRWL